MYNNEHYDHLFYRMKQNIPNNSILFLLISVVKLYPLFLLSHTGGYSTPQDSLSTFHHSFRYFSITYYLQNSFGSGNILVVIGVIFGLNMIIIIVLLYFFTFASKVMILDENYGNMNILGYPFYIFSNIVFFKYIILFQFFIEINFIPLICIRGVVDFNKIAVNNIYTDPSFFSDVNNLCTGNNLISLLVLCGFNLLIDLCFYALITSRFFDYNILSDYKWNFYPSLLFSFEFLECCAQVFFVLFLNYTNSIFKLAFYIYVICLFILHVYQYFNSNFFHTSSTKTYVLIAKYARNMCYIAGVFIAIFQYADGDVPNDINILGLIIFEAIIVYLLISFCHRNDKVYIRNILVNNLNQLNEKNIYGTLIFLITEFKAFNDIFQKFSDKNLDLFLESYVDHLKICEDTHCPCKNYVKKSTGASNTIKSGYTTVINFTHMKKDQQEEYILNKFFNVLAANINATLKYTNNVNLNSIQDTQKRQKLIYQLRIKLITAVKKLISYKLEKLTKDIDGVLTTLFKKETKDFIRINFYSVSVSCNKNYYKTQFLYHEFLSEYFKHHDDSYHLNMIYYFYLKKFSINEYNEHISVIKQGRKENSLFHLDFRTVLGLCVKYYEIEERLLHTVLIYQEFISYFGYGKIIFDNLIKHIVKFKSSYKNVTQYISHYFKIDKINNLFVCTKIILFFKILHFDIPETLHNKLIIQLHDTDDNSKMHSYIDSNYYMILNYIKGEFVIKFISHELLIVLDYSEEELRDKDFHILLPDKIRKLHKNVLINEIKSKSLSSNLKEIFFISKRQTCVLFDIQYKFLLNLKGEITLLTVVNLKKTSKDFRVCFACIDDHGQVLALNKEFEEYLVLSMKVLDYVKIDTEKLILQTMGPRMRNFFKDPENSDFQEQFDYDLYLSSLFDEEFEILKEKNEKEYKKKFNRWEVLKEMNRKGKCYTKYIELNIKQRLLGRETIYFLKYSVKITLSLRSIEPHSTTLSLIHAVKISKREMAKLSFFRGDDLYDTAKPDEIEEKVEEHDDLFESQSQISSAITQLKERNLVRLFKQKKKSYDFLPKGRLIFILMIIIWIFAIISIAFNIVSLFLKEKFYNQTKNYLDLRLNTHFLKKNIYTLSAAMISKGLLEENIYDYSITNKYSVEYPMNLIDLIYKETSELNNSTYTIYGLSSRYFMEKIDEIINTVSDMQYIFTNGITYTNNKPIIDEIEAIRQYGFDDATPPETISKEVIKKYYLMDQIKTMQSTILEKNLNIHNQMIYIYFILHNLYGSLEDYFNKLINQITSDFTQKRKTTNLAVSLMKIGEFLLIFVIIIIEWLFIKFGFKNAKKKMVSLSKRVRQNNIELTMKKIGEFVNFSNTFNLGALYYIADLDLRRVEDSSKTPDNQQSSTSRNNTIQSQVAMTPRKRNTSLLKEREYDSLTDYNIEIKSFTPKVNYLDVGNDNDNNHQSLEPPDGKKNLLKVMQKLDQIKHIKKPKELEKKESEKSKHSVDSSGLCNSEINNVLVGSNHNAIDIKHNDDYIDDNNERNDLIISKDNLGNNDFVKKSSSTSEEEHNNMSIKEKFEQQKFKLQDPIKSALKLAESTSPIQIIDINKIKKNYSKNCSDEINNEEDSKIKIMKANEDTIGLMQPKRNNRKPKVQFKEKKVVYYSPMQNVYDGFECGAQMRSGKSSKKELPTSKDINFNDPNGVNEKNGNTESPSHDKLDNVNNNYRNKDSSLLTAVQSNTPHANLGDMEINTEMRNRNNKFNQLHNQRDSANLDLINLKESNTFNRFNNILGQEGMITVKKRQEQASKIDKDEMEDKIENVVHKNDKAKIILLLTLVAFLISFITSINLNIVYDKQIKEAEVYSNLLVNQNIFFVAVQLKYRLDIMLNLHTDILFDLLAEANANKDKLKLFEVNEQPNILKKAYSLHNSLILNNSCKTFSAEYSSVYSLDEEQEYNECITVAEHMNINGLENGMNYYISTLSTLIDDWRNFGNKEDKIDADVIIEKLQFSRYFNLVIEQDYTLRKYSSLMVKYIKEDVTVIFEAIFFNENIFDYLNISMNLIFLIASLSFIIYPIKSVEIIISWLIHKLVRN